MVEVSFRYQPTLVPLSQSLQVDAAFAALYPEHTRWLRENAVDHRVTGYQWPELMGRMVYNQIGMIVCEFEVFLGEEFAERFAVIKDAARE